MWKCVWLLILLQHCKRLSSYSYSLNFRTFKRFTLTNRLWPMLRPFKWLMARWRHINVMFNCCLLVLKFVQGSTCFKNSRTATLQCLHVPVWNSFLFKDLTMIYFVLVFAKPANLTCLSSVQSAVFVQLFFLFQICNQWPLISIQCKFGHSKRCLSRTYKLCKYINKNI